MADASTSRLTHQLSDDDADGDNENDNTVPPDLDVPIPQEGKAYPDFESLRHAVNAWSLRAGFIARCSKKDTSRAQYRCRYFKNGCPWAVRASIHRNTGLLTITSVNSEHTCNPPEIWVNHEGIAQRGKRAVHATQRWVVDSLNRIGYKPQVTTDPKDIVKIIADRYGTAITEKLALKSRDRLLLQLGIQPPLPHGRGGRPDQVAMRKRMREAEAQMAQQRHEERLDRDGENGIDLDAHGEEAPEVRPFVFESGFRVIDQPQSQIRAPHATAAGGLVSQLHQATVSPSVAIELPPGPVTTCSTCNGSGVIPAHGRQGTSSSRNQVNPAGPAGGRRSSTSEPARASNNVLADSSVGNDDDELSLLRQQVALIAKQIEIIAKRRTPVG